MLYYVDHFDYFVICFHANLWNELQWRESEPKRDT